MRKREKGWTMVKTDDGIKIVNMKMAMSLYIKMKQDSIDKGFASVSEYIRNLVRRELKKK